MRTIGEWTVLTAGAMALLGGCADMGGVQMGSERAKTVATGSAGGSTSTNANAQLEHCDQSLGTLPWWRTGQRWYHYLPRVQAPVDGAADPHAGPAVELLRDRRARPRLQPR